MREVCDKTESGLISRTVLHYSGLFSLGVYSALFTRQSLHAASRIHTRPTRRGNWGLGLARRRRVNWGLGLVSRTYLMGFN